MDDKSYKPGSYRFFLPNKRVSRRTVLRSAALGGAGLAAAAMVGCGDDDDGSTPTPAGTTGGSPTAAATATATQGPVSGGTLRQQGFVTTDAASGYDVHALATVATDYQGLWYQSLLRHDHRDWSYSGEIAEEFEAPSPEEVVLSIRSGVTFHDKPPVDGRELTVDDVVFSLERVRTAEPRFVNRVALANVGTITATDASTVTLAMANPDASIFNKLAGTPMAIMAPEAIEAAPDGIPSTPEYCIGTGPFMVDRGEPQLITTAVRNPNYWKPGLPYLDGIEIPFFSDPSTGYPAYEAGQLDVAILPGEETENYISAQGEGYMPDFFAWDASNTVQLPNTSVAPFDDPRVVRALNLLTNMEDILIGALNPTANLNEYGCIFPAALEEWDYTHEEFSNFLIWQQNKDEAVEEAMQLLTDAGYTTDNPLEFDCLGTGVGTTLLQAQINQETWRQLSGGVVQANFTPVELPVLFARRAQGDFSYYFSGIAVGGPDVDLWLLNLQTDAAANFSRFSDPEVDSLIAQQGAEFDETARKAIVKQIIDICIERGPFVVSRSKYLTARTDAVRGLYSHSNYPYGRQFETVWLAS